MCPKATTVTSGPVDEPDPVPYFPAWHRLQAEAADNPESAQSVAARMRHGRAIRNGNKAIEVVCPVSSKRPDASNHARSPQHLMKHESAFMEYATKYDSKQDGFQDYAATANRIQAPVSEEARRMRHPTHF